MKKLITATFAGAMSVSAIAFGGMSEVFDSDQVGSFAYERVLIGSKSCIYDYVDSSRKSIIHTTVDESCPLTVTDKDIYPDAHYAREKEKRWNDMYDRWYFDNYPHR
jgi:hypothetical protein